MASINETGHARNLENFNGLREYVVSLGPNYQPVNQALSVASLQVMYNAARLAHESLLTQRQVLQNHVNYRQEAFALLSKRSTSAVNMLRSLDVSKRKIANAESILKKIRGERATPKLKLKDGEEDTQISASQLSYDNRLENFKRLVELLGSEGDYSASEAELSLPGLMNYRDELHQRNQAVKQAAPLVSRALEFRNSVFYAENSGLLAVAQKVKDYLEGKYGVRSEVAAGARRFKFRHIR